MDGFSPSFYVVEGSTIHVTGARAYCVGPSTAGNIEFKITFSSLVETTEYYEFGSTISYPTFEIIGSTQIISAGTFSSPWDEFNKDVMPGEMLGFLLFSKPDPWPFGVKKSKGYAIQIRYWKKEE